MRRIWRRLLCRLFGHKYVTRVDVPWDKRCERCGRWSVDWPEHINCRCFPIVFGVTLEEATKALRKAMGGGL